MTVDELAGHALKIAVSTHADYHRWVRGVDLLREMDDYLASNRRMFERLDEDDALRAIEDAARLYCERAKAAVCGYEYRDVAWYTPGMVLSLLPLALDPEWDGQTGESDGEGGGSAPPSEGGTLLAMVADVRRAIRIGKLPGSVGAYDVETDTGMAYVEALVAELGGARPAAPGFERRAA